MEAPRTTIKRAKALRRTMSLPELLLWNALRRRELDGFRVRRQHPLGPYILDFYCDASRLAVEIDGWGHKMGDQPARDARRDAWLAKRGVRTMRIPAAELLHDFDEVLWSILAEAVARRAPSTASRSPSPKGGGA